jgi:hypothetical protein
MRRWGTGRLDNGLTILTLAAAAGWQAVADGARLTLR